LTIETTAVQELAHQTKTLLSRLPSLLVVVVAPQDLVFGLGRMWGAYASSSLADPHLFRTRPEAERWIEDQLKGLNGRGDR
jgi:hypothetical protein